MRRQRIRLTRKMGTREVELHVDGIYHRLNETDVESLAAQVLRVLQSLHADQSQKEKT